MIRELPIVDFSGFNSENPSKFSDITAGDHIAQKIEESNKLK